MQQSHAARCLVRGARSAVLATADGAQPHAALVTHACMADFSIVLLLSELSRHTAQLRANSQCALFCAEAPGSEANPQTARRISLTCTARPDVDPALRARFLTVHPYARMYAGFGDFRIWRLAVTHAHLVAGFAQAFSIEGAALAPDAADVSTIAAAEAGVIAHCNADHAAAMERVAVLHGGAAAAWRLAAIDVDGCDLAAEDGVVRAAWRAPVRHAGDVRQALVELVRAAD